MDLGLQNRRCVVLGASRGIGRAIARGLAVEGAAVSICGRDPVSLAAYLDAARAALGGSVLLVSSISGLEASPSPDFAYSTVKAALIAYTKKLALAHAAGNVRVNAIAPGSIEFPGGTWAQVKEHQPSFYQRVRASIPSGRMGTPEEVADVAVFLCSPRAAWIIGECVVVDGGQHRAMR
jgi:3-oxoacyl-[acyl-carrier protein] reductase